ncbi:MAG TPA: hypothetical protein VMW16_16065 [Sedimentisphaerales bacterium]|nr:hypothetical protein [Sedimentisphaerales bacterium]
MNNKPNERGTALLVVLIVVMAVTILSLGFLARSDVELACGENTILRVQMDYLAESGLEHARGLILNPQDVGSEYWTGAARQQLVAGSDDYYDVNVVKAGASDYQITARAYREKNGQEVGRSSLSAELRLDPSMAYYSAGNSSVSGGNVTINGDVYCGGSLTNNSIINGDVFAVGLSGSGVKSGQLYGIDEAAGITSPDVNAGYFPPGYVTDSNGNVELINESLAVSGMLVIDGNMIIDGGAITITAAKNAPALLVDGQLVLKNAAMLEVNGLAQAAGPISVEGGSEATISGALFIIGSGGISGDGRVVITANPDKASLKMAAGGPQKWSPAGGAFFRSILRQ